MGNGRETGGGAVGSRTAGATQTGATQTQTASTDNPRSPSGLQARRAGITFAIPPERLALPKGMSQPARSTASPDSSTPPGPCRLSRHACHSLDQMAGSLGSVGRFPKAQVR